MHYYVSQTVVPVMLLSNLYTAIINFDTQKEVMRILMPSSVLKEEKVFQSFF
jgi:hypothetical protein